MRKKRFIVLIGDIVASRQIRNRAEFQRGLESTLRKVNGLFEEAICSKLTLTLGDEFQGVLNSGERICELIDTLIAALYPVKCRFGIGIGQITTELNPEMCLAADGPAFWCARDAVKYIHENDDYGSSRIFVRSETNDKNLKLINTSFAANSLIFDGWRATQVSVLQGLISSGMYNPTYQQIKLAEYMGLSPAALQKRIKGSGINVYLRNHYAISEAICFLQKR